MVPTVIGVTLLIFATFQFFTPAQRASLYATDVKQLSDITFVIKKYRLDQPIYVQYAYWINEVLKGNLGYSRASGQPVIKTLLERLPSSVEIAMYSLPAIILVGIYLGVLSAVHRDKLIDHVSRTFAIIGWSLPTFWLAILLLAVFYGGLGWFSPGRLSTAANSFVKGGTFVRYTHINTIDALLNGELWIFWDALNHLVLPVITLTVVIVALIMRVMRSSMLEELNRGYVMTARAKGLAEKEVINKHARRNALIPVVTLAGLLAAGIINGVTVVEFVFGIDGIGSFAVLTAMTLDISGLLGFVLFNAILFVIANLVVDILYAYLDPRIRLG